MVSVPLVYRHLMSGEPINIWRCQNFRFADLIRFAKNPAVREMAPLAPASPFQRSKTTKLRELPTQTIRQMAFSGFPRCSPCPSLDDQQAVDINSARFGQNSKTSTAYRHED